MCVCVAKPVAVELRCHATALISIGQWQLTPQSMVGPNSDVNQGS